MTNREKIIKIIEQDGPAEVVVIARRLGLKRSGTRQLMIRMVADGQLATLKNAPRTYITTGAK